MLGMAFVLSAIASSAGTLSHRIHKGDTLWDIAKKYHTTPKAIAKANHCRETSTLAVDKVIRIPTKDCPTEHRRSKKTERTAHLKHREHHYEKSHDAEPKNDDSVSSSRQKPSKEGTSSLIRTAMRLRGSRYSFGGVSRSGFDCSGFTCYVYERHGITLPHSSAGQAHVGRPVSREDLRQGDLVFFSTRGRSIGHVGMYIGGSRFVHAATYREGVRVDSLNAGYYRERYRGARRVR